MHQQVPCTRKNMISLAFDQLEAVNICMNHAINLTS